MYYWRPGLSTPPPPPPPQYCLEPVNGVSEEPELVVTLELVMSLLWSSVSRIVFIKSFRLSFSAINIIIVGKFSGITSFLLRN